MSELRALIVGVSDYSKVRQKNLPFCVNDIGAVENAFAKGLNVNASNIYTCGKSGSVSGNDFIGALNQMSQITICDDTLLFYFSGHGGILSNEHHLVLSDTTMKTQEVIAYLENISAKNKVILLDCCMAGNFDVNNTAVFDIDSTADDFAGKGYAVIASSNATQLSYGHPEKSISLFTNFLCEALNNRFLIREGKKSLYEIKKLLFLYLEIWNKQNPKQMQNPIFRANMGGTIYFDFQEYTPYEIKQFHEETEDYIIYSVEPIHNGIAKRFRVQVILRKPFSFEEVSALNHEVIEKVKCADIYHNEITQRLWRNKSANLVFCYFGFDEDDMINANYICYTTWADETQDKNWWYKLHKNNEIINDIHFNFKPYYESHKEFIGMNTGTKDDLVSSTRVLITQMVTLAEQIIALYNEFINSTKSEQELADDISAIKPELDRLYFAEGNLAIPPKELKEWSEGCACLASTIHEFTFNYGLKFMSERTPENRKACMDITIARYYEDLENFKNLELTIRNR